MPVPTKSFDSTVSIRETFQHLGEFTHAIAVVRKIADNLVYLVLQDTFAQHLSHFVVRPAHAGRQITNPGWIETTGGERCAQLMRELEFAVAQGDTMLRSTQPVSSALYELPLHELVAHDAPNRVGDARHGHAAQAPAIDSRLPGMLRVELA